MQPAELIEVRGSRVLGAVPPALMHEVGDVVCFALTPWSRMRMVNRAVGITSRTTDAELDEAEAFFQDAGVQYQLCPSEPGIETRLEARGLVAGYPWMKFTRNVAPLSPGRSTLRLERIGPGQAPDFARVVRETWDMPAELDPWLEAMVEAPGYQCYVTYEGDEPAGAGSLFVDGSIAWLGFGSTLPGFRGRGSQSALFAARIAEAARQGATLVVTETGVAGEEGPGPSYRNILRAGFDEAYVRPNYLRP
jgi:GNAT superfamily N-acetyltransferase